MALSSARLQEWMAADLSGLDILVVQIDGIHISEHIVLVAAIGIDSEGVEHDHGRQPETASDALHAESFAA